MTIVTVLIGILGFGVLVFIHELGHFLAAKFTGVKVEVFSIGWGNAIIKKKIKNTVYQIGFIPFGGYCKLAGEMIDAANTAIESHDHFYCKKPWQKLIVVSSGILFNIIFALLLLTALGLFPSQESISPPTIYISEDLYEMPAYKSGLRTGDTITYINNIPVASYNAIAQTIVNSMGDPITIKYLRNQQTEATQLIPLIDKNSGRAMIGIYPFIKPIISSIDANSPLYDTRIVENSEIINAKIKNKKEIIEIKSAVQLNKITQENGYQLEYIGIRLPDGNFFTKNIESNTNISDLMITYKSTIVEIPGLPLLASFSKSFSKSYKLTITFFKSLKVLFSGKISVRNALSGPLKLIHYSSEIAKTGMINYIGFLALLSLILGLTNLIPIPGVDGSFIVFFLIEIIGRRELNKKILMKIQQVGMTMLLILMSLVIVNDIFFLIKG